LQTSSVEIGVLPAAVFGGGRLVGDADPFTAVDGSALRCWAAEPGIVLSRGTVRKLALSVCRKVLGGERL
jgi:hypothetical protein